MSKIKPERAFSSECFQGFGGIRNDVSESCKGAAEITNFRILADGSLEKRGGWISHYYFGQTLRGMWEGDLDGGHYVLAVYDDTVCRVNPSTEEITWLSYLTTSTGDVGFSEFEGALYLSDGEELYLFNTAIGRFEAAGGYVPLYGENWHPVNYGTAKESPNLLTPRLRLNYLNTTAANVFHLPFYAATVDAVYVNGAGVAYSFTPYSDVFSISQSSVGASVDVVFTVAEETDDRASVVQTVFGSVVREKGRDTMLRFNGPTAYKVYPSYPVSDEMLTAARAKWAGADRLYFRLADVLTAGDTDHPIQTVIRFGERNLGFSDSLAYAITLPENPDAQKGSILPLCTGIGCSSPGAVMPCENSLLVVNEHGIYKMRAVTSAVDHFYTEKISDPVGHLLTPSFLSNAILRYDEKYGEYWFRDRTDATGRTVIWNSGSGGRFYCFLNIPADKFFDTVSFTGFLSGNHFCELTDTAVRDDFTPITAVYQSEYLSFNRSDALKRALRLITCAKTGGSTLSVCVETEKATKTVSAAGSPTATAPETFDKRLRLGRFRFLRFRFTVTGTAKCRIQSARLFANL